MCKVTHAVQHRVGMCTFKEAGTGIYRPVTKETTRALCLSEESTFLVLISAKGLLEVFPDCALLDCSINAQLLQVVCIGTVPTPRALLLVKEVLAPFTAIILW